MEALLKRHEGHDSMDMDSASSSMMHMMTPFHFSGGDTLWFSGWTPTSAGAIFGASFGLFLLAAFWRLLIVATYQLNHALSTRSISALERHYTLLAQAQQSNQNGTDKRSGSETSSSSSSSAVREKALDRARSRVRNTPPFMLSHELARACCAVCTAAVGYLLMLAVMTSNLYYFFAILLGIFAGEVSFGRFGAMSSFGH